MNKKTTSDFRCLPKGWTAKTVSYLIDHEILERPMDGNHGGKHPKGSDYVEDGIPFIMATDIKDGQIDFNDCKYISKQLADSLDKGFSYTGDVLLTHKASLGRTALVGILSTPYIMLTPQVTYYRIKNKNILNNAFLKFYFDSPFFQETLINHGDIGSTRAYIGITAQKDLPILLIPLPEQNAIAKLLCSYNDKIDLLHRQNKTLEAMAETLFRQWFVEEVNENWKQKPLSNIAQFLNGLACQNYLPENDVDKLPVLKIRELSNGISDDSDWATNKVDEEYLVKNGDVIFAWSASLMVKLWDGETCILNQHLFKVTSTDYPKWFYLMWCKKHLDEFIAIAQTHATTMGHIKRGDLDAAMVIIPPKEIMVQMTEIMSPIIEKQIENSKQIKVLKNLRDTLLPKLMSGEVRVEV